MNDDLVKRLREGSIRYDNEYISEFHTEPISRMFQNPPTTKELEAADTIKHLSAENAALKPFAAIGKRMVEITTTVQHPEEWSAIPDIWLDAHKEDRKKIAELESGQPVDGPWMPIETRPKGKPGFLAINDDQTSIEWLIDFGDQNYFRNQNSGNRTLQKHWKAWRPVLLTASAQEAKT